MRKRYGSSTPRTWSSSASHSNAYAASAHHEGAIVAFTVALHAEQPSLHRVLFEEASRLASVRKRAAQLEQRLTALVARLLREHRQSGCSDPELSAYVVVRTVDALVHGWVTRPKTAPLDVRALQREIVKLVMSYAAKRRATAT